MKFLENKYTDTYYSIIYRAKARPEIMSYTEKHHIIPKSLGGNNSTENIAILTAREHFICHMLLIKMTAGNDRYKMIHAAIGMKRMRSYQDRYINARLYEIVRKEFATISSIRNKGKTMSDESRAKMSIASKGRPKSDETKLKMSLATKGRPKGPMKEETKLKIAATSKGKPSQKKGKISGPQHTTDSKAKIAESNKRRIYSQETKDKIAAGLRAYNAMRNSSR
jgi:hypothetical protein